MSFDFERQKHTHELFSEAASQYAQHMHATVACMCWAYWEAASLNNSCVCFVSIAFAGNYHAPILVFTHAQSSLTLSLHSCSVFTHAQSSLKLSLHSCSVFTQAQSSLMLSLHSCSVFTHAQSALTLSFYSRSVLAHAIWQRDSSSMSQPYWNSHLRKSVTEAERNRHALSTEKVACSSPGSVR